MQVSDKEAKSLASNTGILVDGDESQQSVRVFDTADPRVWGIVQSIPSRPAVFDTCTG